MEEDEWLEFLDDMDNSYDEERILGLLEQQEEDNSHDRRTGESRIKFGRQQNKKN